MVKRSRGPGSMMPSMLSMYPTNKVRDVHLLRMRLSSYMSTKFVSSWLVWVEVMSLTALQQRSPRMLVCPTQRWRLAVSQRMMTLVIYLRQGYQRYWQLHLPQYKLSLRGVQKGVSAEHLAKVWCIPHDDAARTLGVMTQSLCHNPDSSLSRNVRTNDWAVRYRKIKSFFFMDTLFVTSAAKSSRGNICAQLFVSDKGFVAFYPMKKQQEVYLAVKQFAKEVGAPEVLVCDPHPAQIKREVREFCTQIGTTLKVLEAETQWANRAELYIGLMKEATRKDMHLSGSLLVLWDYCMERWALIFQITAKKIFQLNGTNPHTSTFGSEADISHICQYGWYNWVYYRDAKTSFPYQKERLGRCLGPAKNEGNAIVQWILKENGKVIPRHRIRRLTPAELSPSNEVESEKQSLFNVAVRGVLGDSVKIPKIIPLDNDAPNAFDA